MTLPSKACCEDLGGQVCTDGKVIGMGHFSLLKEVMSELASSVSGWVEEQYGLAFWAGAIAGAKEQWHEIARCFCRIGFAGFLPEKTGARGWKGLSIG